MKSRELKTTPVLIVSNYVICPDSSGRWLHKFTPESTSTVYQMIANKEPIFLVGERYNIGYETESGINWVDISATSRADVVEPTVSHYVASKLGQQRKHTETQKSNDRVVHSAIDGVYLGKKYAWRIYGMALARDTFDEYLNAIDHPRVSCLTDGSPSIAFKDEGIRVAVDALIASCIRVGNVGNRFSSSLLPRKKWFMVKGLEAITDKK